MKTLVRSILISSLVLIAFALFTFPTQAEPQMIALGTLGGNNSVALDINEKNQIVGWAATTYGTEHAFLWQNGVMQDLGTLGGEFSYAAAINNKGMVVGRSENFDGNTHAFIWNGSKMTDLGTLGGYLAIAYDINDRGQIVGVSINNEGEWHAFLWQRGMMQDLGTLGGNYSEAREINERGEIVGFSRNSQNEQKPFLWKNGVMNELNTLGGSGTAEAINDKGLIVGGSLTAKNEGRLVGWLPRTLEIYDLGIYPGYAGIDVQSVNNSGAITGYFYQFTSYDIHCYVYQNGIATDIGNLGEDYCLAWAINDAGFVVGTSALAPEQGSAFLWTP